MSSVRHVLAGGAGRDGNMDFQIGLNVTSRGM